jgi:adenine C2-methylase RlmN of 23S rRNA A2503 and tRNA A37
MVIKRYIPKKSVFDQDAILEVFQENGIKATHAMKIPRYVLKYRNLDYENIEGLPLKAIEILKDQFAITTLVEDKKRASDGSTTKLLIRLQDGQKIETVIMRYGDVDLRSFPESERIKKQLQQGDIGDNMSIMSTSTTSRRFKSNRRVTVCVSSQVGCAMGCKFCATGTMGLLSDMTSGEILEQLYHARGEENIRNVVFMGMGEPLDNYEEVLKAIQSMGDPGRYI